VAPALPEAILIPPALLVVTDFSEGNYRALGNTRHMNPIEMPAPQYLPDK